jgi:integrase
MSIRKRTWETESGKGEAWFATVGTQQRDKKTGRIIRTTKSFQTLREAQAWVAKSTVAVAEGKFVPDAKSPTVAEAGITWMASCRDLEKATCATYQQHLNLHILPFVGDMKLSQLSVGTVKAWQDKLHEQGRSDDMVRRATLSLGSLLAEAQERGHVAQNVVRSLRRHRKRDRTQRQNGGKLRVGVDIPTPAEIDNVLGASIGSRWRPFLMMAIRCGLRASELRGLLWKNIDFARGELHVTQRADRYRKIGQPKSRAGDRTVPIPPATLKELREWKVRCPRKDGELLYVFPNGLGNIEVLENIVNRGIKPLWVKAGIIAADGRAKYTGLHCLRHYYASWCGARKVDNGLEWPLSTVSKRMGHSSIALTADRYSHLFPRGDDSAELAAAEGQNG